MKMLNKVKIILAVLVSIVGFVFDAIPASAVTQELGCSNNFAHDSYRYTHAVAETEEYVDWARLNMILNWTLGIMGLMSFPLTIASVVLIIIGAKKQPKIKEENEKVENGKKKKNGTLVAGIIMLCAGVVNFIISMVGFVIVQFVMDGTFC